MTMPQLRNDRLTYFTTQCLYAAAAILAFLAATCTASAQANRFLQQGNKYYEQGKYKEAADDYAKALHKDNKNASGLFNLGNALYQQQRFDSSRKFMAEAEKHTNDKKLRAATNYNIGNTYMAQQKWEDAINAYKQTLRSNPNDVDAKYNLSYAEEMLKKQNQQNQNKQNKQNKDQQNKDKQNQQNKDQKDKQDKNQQNKDQQNKDQKDQQNKDQQEPQGQPSKISQQDAENLLNALQQQEKKLQDKMNKEKGVSTKMEKDW